MIFALIGNQNCGKTTLFNQLTGANQHVGNFPGVTVDQKVGEIKEHKNCSVVDLPGIYSLRPYTSEEIVTRDFLINEKPDAIINIVDATNIERNLYLTLQLLEMQIPMVLALNMMDEVRNNGGSIDVMGISEKLGIPVVPISAVKAEGISELVEKVIRTAEKKKYPKITDFCEKGPVHRCIHALSHQVEDHAQNLGISPRFAATKVVENDVEIIKKLNFSRNEFEMMQHSIEEMEADHKMDRNAALADMRYTFIEKVCKDTVKHPKESKEHKRSEKIDKVLTNKYLAIPMFLAIMMLIFYLTFGLIGAWLSDLLSLGIEQITDDHSLVEEMVKQGNITESEARIHPQKNIITRALGINEEVQADFFEIDVEQGDVIMLCSDGLSNMIEDEDMEYIVKNSDTLQTAAESLVARANENGGNDNITVVLAEV